MNFLYVKIPVAKNVLGQARLLEDTLDQILRESGVGSVAGWGDSLGDALPDGSRPVAYTRIDVDVVDLAAALAILHANLPALGAPAGTEIHCTINHRHRKDRLFETEWLLDQSV